MDLKHSFTFGGVNTANYGIFISGEGVYNSPERDVTMLTVPGRNGQLTIDNGRFENIEVTYPCFIEAGTGATDISARIRAFRNAIGSLTGYQRLEDTYHSDEYRQGIFRAGLNVEPVVYHTGGKFEIAFDCKPQRWRLPEIELLAGQSSPADITPFTMQPVFDIYYFASDQGTSTFAEFEFTNTRGSQDYKITVDLSVLNQNITGMSGLLHVDCELIEAYQYSNYDDTLPGTESGAIINLNSAVTIANGIPEVYPEGGQKIRNQTNVSNVVARPRYWRI